MGPLPRLSRWAGYLAGAGAVAGGWALLEPHLFTLRFAVAPVLPPGTAPIRVLHLSDLHLTPTQRDKQDWIRRLGDWEPDLVVITGDFLAHRDAVAPVLAALGPLGTFPGVFVLGSNDYFAPRMDNPARYLLGPSQVKPGRFPMPWGDLVAGLLRFGWRDLDNAEAHLSVRGTTVEVRGVDDPHLQLDAYDAGWGPYDPAVDLRLGISHAPYLRVLDAMRADGADLILAGHTHGGQLCVPLLGAIVTNCDLPVRFARGLHRYPDDAGDTWLNVSAGLGASPFTPVRFACRPEATLLTLVGRENA